MLDQRKIIKGRTIWAGRLLVSLMAAFALLMPTLAQAAFVSPSTITIDGTFTDWAGNVYSQADGYTPPGTSGAADITNVWFASSTANGTSPASGSNLLQNMYYRFDTAATSSSNPRQAFWVQLNLGTAPVGSADHILQFYVNTTSTPVVAIVLYSYGSSPYPAMSAFTTGSITAQVSNQSSGYGVYDANATGTWALNGSTYSFEAKIPIGWFSSTYLGSVTNDGTGAASMATAFFTSTGSMGSVGTVKDQLDDASGNVLYSTTSTTTGSVTYATGNNYYATAAAATLTPAVGASDTITLTVKKADGTTDTAFAGAKNVTISGYSAAPNGSYGSFNGTTLTASPNTISVTFASGVATPALILNKSAAQTIGFSIAGVTNPDTNTLTITPTAGTAAALKMQQQPVGSAASGGGTLATQPIVQVVDAYQNVVTTSSASVVAAYKTASGSWSLGGTLTKAASSGVSTYTDLTGTTSSGSDVTTAAITFTSGSLTAVDSSTFTVKAALQSNYTATASAATLTPVAGANDNITLTVKKSDGSTDTAFTGAHNVTISGFTAAPNASYGSFNGTTLTTPAGQIISVTFASGTATVALALNNAAEQIIGFSIAGVTTPATNTLTITPTAAAAASLGVTTQHSGTETAGTAFSITLTAKDAYGNTDTSYTGAKSITWTWTATNSPNSTAPTKPADGNQTFASGAVTVSGFTLYNTGETPTITATGPSSITGNTGALTVNAGAVASYAAVTQHSGTETAGTAFSVTLTAKDSSGNTVTSYSGAKSVTWTWTATNSPNSTAPTKPADGNQTFASGAVTVSGFTLTNAGETPTITGTTADAAGTTSAITVNVGAVASYTAVTQHSSVETAGTAFSVTLTAKDSSGNTVTSYSGAKSVTWTWTATNSPNNTAPTKPADGNQTFALGAVTVSGFTLYNAGETPTITGTTADAAGTTSAITVNAATATVLAFTTQPAGATAGSAFSTQPVVKTQDAYGNNSVVGLATSKTVTIAIKTGSGTLQGTTSYDIGTGAGNGTITGVGLRIDQPGDFTLSATVVADLTEGDSGSFTVAASLSISNSPSVYAFGIVTVSSTTVTGLTYFTLTNNGGVTVNVTISGTDMTGGVTWTLSNTATAGANTVGINAGLEGGSYNIIVKKTSSYNNLVANLTAGSSQRWGLQLLAPTSYSDGSTKTGTITLTATQA